MSEEMSKEAEALIQAALWQVRNDGAGMAQLREAASRYEDRQKRWRWEFIPSTAIPGDFFGWAVMERGSNAINIRCYEQKWAQFVCDKLNMLEPGGK